MLRFVSTILALVFFAAPAFADCATPGGYTRWGSSSWLYSEAIAGAPGFEKLPTTGLPADITVDMKAAGKHSTGRTIRFKSNSDTLHLCWEMGTLDPDHIDIWSPTGKSGIDVYTRPASGGEWVWVSSGIPNSANMGEAYFNLGTTQDREFMVHLPPGRRTTLFRTEVKTGSTFTKSAAPPNGPYVLLGSSITWGASASRPGASYPSILARRADVDLINLSFAGACQTLVGLATLMASVDASAYIIDCFPNMSPAMITDQLPGFLEELAGNVPSTTPIYVLQDRRYQNQFDPTLQQSNADKEAAMTAALAPYLLLYPNIHFIPSDDFLGDDWEAMGDPSHPSDLGHRRIADDLEAKMAAF